MVVSHSRKAGFFAELTTVIRHLKKVRDDDKLIFIDWNKQNSLYYDSRYGENVWEYYFNPIDIIKHDNIDYILNDYIDIYPINGLNVRETFSKIYSDNIVLNEKTKKIITDNNQTINENTLGVHIRKTDKFLCNQFNEPMSHPVDDKLVFNLIDKKLEKSFDRIFLATDCLDTYNTFIERYGNIIIKTERIRGFGTNAIHTSNGNDGYRKGLESLIDSYALSKCGFLIRSTSNLSSFSMFINLNLDCINLNEIYKNDNREHEFNIYSKI
jgi:hypothetical protein